MLVLYVFKLACTLNFENHLASVSQTSNSYLLVHWFKVDIAKVICKVSKVEILFLDLNSYDMYHFTLVTRKSNATFS